MKVILDYNKWTVGKLLSYIAFSVLLVNLLAALLIDIGISAETSFVIIVLISVFAHPALKYFNDFIFISLMQEFHKSLLLVGKAVINKVLEKIKKL